LGSQTQPKPKKTATLVAETKGIAIRLPAIIRAKRPGDAPSPLSPLPNHHPNDPPTLPRIRFKI